MDTRYRMQCNPEPMGGWDVIRADERVVLEGEGYQVASNVLHSLQHGAQGMSECDEVARAILAVLP